jgi:hypothetical protein
VEFYDILIKDYLSHVTKAPRYIFILLSPTTFTSKSDNFEAIPIHRYLESPMRNIEIVIKYDRYSSIIPMYRKSFKKGINNILKMRYPKVSTQDSVSKYKGFVIHNGIVSLNAIAKDEYNYKPFLTESFDHKKAELLKQITNSLKKKDIDVVFFELPTNQLKTYFNIKFLNQYEEELRDLGKNYTVIRISSKLFTIENYRDIEHINTKGSIIATKEIIRSIIDIENLNNFKAHY